MKKCKRTSAVFLGQIGEPPHISKAHCVSYGRQEESELAIPIFTLVLARFRLKSLAVIVAGTVSCFALRIIEIGEPKVTREKTSGQVPC